ncbi:hypothetical protein HispidOSU_020494, partial [Sigmodon hispidus]
AALKRRHGNSGTSTARRPPPPESGLSSEPQKCLESSGQGRHPQLRLLNGGGEAPPRGKLLEDSGPHGRLRLADWPRREEAGRNCWKIP